MDTVNVLFMIPGLLPSLQMGCCHLLPEQSGVNDSNQVIGSQLALMIIQPQITSSGRLDASSHKF
jgi:hypothetical protein